MTKKSRRKEKGRRIRLSPAQMVRPGMNEIADASAEAGLVNHTPQKSNLQEEYRYVIADLKRIGVIALVMLVVLIALALLLT